MRTLLWWPYYLLVATTTLFVGYYVFLAVACLVLRGARPARREPRTRFLILVPAHNEATALPRVLPRFTALDYPRDLYDVVVIADNCSDETADVARSFGVSCLERREPLAPGKGQALRWALQRLPLARYDAVAIIDADTIPDPVFLRVMNDFRLAGALAIQGHNNLSNPHDNGLTRLIYITNVLKNRFYNEAKQRLGLSVALMGTGMVLDARLLERHGWTAMSVGEDWEFSEFLATAGVRIHFALEAITYAEEARSFGQAFSQRLRWSGGKFEVASRLGVRSFLRGLATGNLSRADAALNVLLPSYSLLLNATIAQGVIGLLHPSGATKAVVLGVTGVSLLLQGAYLFLGFLYTDRSLRTLLSVLIAPVFLGWKMLVDVLALLGVRRHAWTRTVRNV